MSELTARQALQATAQGASSFSNDNVVLNDFSVLEATGAMNSGPKLIIFVSQDFESLYESMSGEETTWEIEAGLYQPWNKVWSTTLEDYAASRQDLLDQFTAGARAPGSGKYYNVARIYAGGPLDRESRSDVIQYMVQTIVFSVEEMD